MAALLGHAPQALAAKPEVAQVANSPAKSDVVPIRKVVPAAEIQATPPTGKGRAAKAAPLPARTLRTVSRTTIRVESSVMDRAQNAVYWLSGPPLSLSMRTFGERAFEELVSRLEREFNEGKPFSAKPG